MQANGVVIGTPEVSQTQQAFDDGIGILDAPALPIQSDGDVGRQVSSVEFVGEVAIPQAAIQHFDQAYLLARAVPITADPHNRVMHRGAGVQAVDELIRQVGLGPGQEGDLACAQLSKMGKIGIAQVEHQECTGLDFADDVFPKRLVVRAAVRGIPNVDGQARPHVQQCRHASGQWMFWQIAQHFELADQAIQRRAIAEAHLGVVRLRPFNLGGAGGGYAQPSGCA